MTQGIYKITHRQSGKAYRGGSINIEKRWGEHRRALGHGKHHCIHLQRAWNKYGEGAFEFCVLEVIEDTSLLTEIEQEYLDAFWGNCYNVAPFAGAPMRGRTLTEDHKRKIGEASTGNQYCLGYKHTEEFCRKQSERMMGNQNTRGYKHTPESRQKMSDNNTGEGNPMWGKHHTEEANRKNREAHLGKKLTEDHKRKIGDAVKGPLHPMWGKHHTLAAKQKMSDAKRGNQYHLGHKHSDATKQKISIIKLARRGALLQYYAGLAAAIPTKPEMRYCMPEI